MCGPRHGAENEKGSLSCLGQDAEEDVSVDGADDVSFFPFPPESLLYPEAYQPPPFRTKDVLEISLWDVPPQTGQILSLSWKSFCHSSKIWRQSSQQY
jgi:hypothetical protein